MTADEFRARVEQPDFIQLIGTCLHDDLVPYVFEPKPATWAAFRDELAAKLDVSSADIRVVGSGRFGFSLRPYRNLASFRDSSDVDVVVVNAAAFDHLWSSLLRAAYPRPPITDQLGGWLKKGRNEVYTGYLTPLEIRIDARIFGVRAKPVLDVRTRWFNALKLASRHPPRAHEGIKGRLYRTWEHAELYHLDGLAALRRTLLQMRTTS